MSESWHTMQDKILSALMDCKISGARVMVRTGGSMVVLVRATRDEYEGCIVGVLDRYNGELQEFRRIGRVGIGTLYEYMLVFRPV